MLNWESTENRLKRKLTYKYGVTHFGVALLHLYSCWTKNGHADLCHHRWQWIEWKWFRINKVLDVFLSQWRPLKVEFKWLFTNWFIVDIMKLSQIFMFQCFSNCILPTHVTAWDKADSDSAALSLYHQSKTSLPRLLDSTDSGQLPQ